jgi:MoaA/NifB/PqqE/SkfB family radical SAM enzyme
MSIVTTDEPPLVGEIVSRKLNPLLPHANVGYETEVDQLVHDAYWYYHSHYEDYKFIDEHLGLPISQQPNDISRHVSALQYFLDKSLLDKRPLGINQQVAVLKGIARSCTDRVPLVLLGELLLGDGRLWEAFDAITGAIEYGGYCQISLSILLATLRRLPIPGYWADFFNRVASPSIAELGRDGSTTEMFDYLIEFTRAVRACDSLDAQRSADDIRLFYHRWWKVYRHADSRIGLFRAYGNSDQSRHIGALRHVVEFAAYRRLAGASRNSDQSTAEWLRSCCTMTLAAESHVSELPVFLLTADFLGNSGRLDEALTRGYRAFNTNSRCLLTQHVLDCVEHALERQSNGLSCEFSLLAETPQRFTGKFCNIPFDDAFINPDGDVFLCCAAMLPVAVGNIFKEQRWDEIWNSDAAQVIRESILDGSYKYCNKRSCPVILNDGFVQIGKPEDWTDLRDRWRRVIEDQSVRITDTLFADLGYDASCNLSCPQCRLELFVSDRAGFARLDAAREGKIDDLLSRLRNVRITSGGEALFSRHFRKVLGDINPQMCPNLTHLELLTNGMLFNKKQWYTFENLHYLKILVVFSIDACSKETFETIRRNGQWTKMIENLEFASDLRKERKITKFQISYAVQAANFREMPELVRLVERLNVDEVAFFKLENVGTYTEDEYRSRSVVDPSHPLHGEFLEVLRDPALASPIVAAHNLGPLITAIHGPGQERPWLADDPFWGRIYF